MQFLFLFHRVFVAMLENIVLHILFTHGLDLIHEQFLFKIGVGRCIGIDIENL